MEMRRLASRKPTSVADNSRGSSRAERALLYAYWAVSGYGLRASRALITLALLVTGAALLERQGGELASAGDGFRMFDTQARFENLHRAFKEVACTLVVA